MKLQKYLSQSGVCSRRKAEQYISQWLVTVNWETAHIWQVISPETDEIKIDNKIIEAQENLVYYILNKPRWIVTTLAKNENEKWILDIVDFPERVFPIGRLDKETTWLIILTNDWRLSNYLIHPRYEHQKEYFVEVYGKIEDKSLDRMRRWVKIELKENSRNNKNIGTKIYKTKPCLIERLSSSKFNITLEEWKNRQIRRMVSAVNHDIKKLKRIRIENIHLWNLAEWEYRPLSNNEKETLFKRIWIENIKK